MKRSNAGTGGTAEAKDEYIRQIALAMVEGRWIAGSMKKFAVDNGLELETAKQYSNTARRYLRIFKPGGGF